MTVPRKISKAIRGTCVTGKQRYRDWYSANDQLGRALKSTSVRRGEVRAYRCQRCAGWHLTSQPLQKAI